MADQYTIPVTRRNSPRGTDSLEVTPSDLLDATFSRAQGATLVRGMNGWQPATPIVTDLYGTTVTFDLGLSLIHAVTLTATITTLALANVVVGSKFIVLLVQGGSGSYLVTNWFATVKWSGGSAPTLTTATGKTDAFEFLCTASGAYLNLWQTLNM